MPRAKKIPPIPFEFTEAVKRLLQVKPEPKKPKATKRTTKRKAR